MTRNAWRAKAADPDDADAQAPEDSMVLVSKRSTLAVVELRVRQVSRTRFVEHESSSRKQDPVELAQLAVTVKNAAPATWTHHKTRERPVKQLVERTT